MNTKQEILDFLTSHQQEIASEYHVNKIALFGSFSRGEQTQKSDVDLLIEIEEGTKNIHDLKISLQTYLSTVFEHSVDLAREKYLKPYAKELILKDAIYVY